MKLVVDDAGKKFLACEWLKSGPIRIKALEGRLIFEILPEPGILTGVSPMV